MRVLGTSRKREPGNLAKANRAATKHSIVNQNNIELTQCQQIQNNSTLSNSTNSEIVNSQRNSITNPNPNTKSGKVLNFDDERYQSKFGTGEKEEYKGKLNSNKKIIVRPYLFDIHTMSRIKQILFLALTSGAVPWKWDKRQHKIQNIFPTVKKFWEPFRVIFFLQTCFITMFQIYTSYEMALSGKYTNREIFITSLNMIWYLQWLDYAVNWHLYGEQIRNYINTLFKFNHDMVKRFVIKLDGQKERGRMIMNYSIIGDLTAVFVSIVYFLKMPYAPWYLFPYVYPKPWYWLIPGVVQTYCIIGQVITSHTLISWIMVSHSNTLQFWLKEIHTSNDIKYTLEDLRKGKTSFEVYKSLQVLNNCFNDCVSPLFIPMILVHTGGVAIACGYVMIRSMNGIFIQEFPQSVYYPMDVANCTVCAFVMLNMASLVFDLSASWIDSWSQIKDKIFRRKVTSCSALKIFIGRFDFITVSTTITFSYILWDNITNALLTFE